jgi:pyruvate formate lyase activating enzyme
MNVYLKGCPLRCAWCHSPESQSPRPERVWYETRCTGCGACADACPDRLRAAPGALGDEARPRCRLCGACVRACPGGALEILGRTVRAAEIIDQAVRLEPFFRRTGGGVTLTGGEPTAQPRFALAVARLCRRAGIHVAVETCGLVEPHTLEELAAAVDLVLFDVKHADETAHRRYTGVSSRPILDNLARLGASGADVVARVPLVPAFNDDADAIRAIGQGLIERGVRRATLLPFNPATAGKYAWLGRTTPFAGAAPQDAEQVAALEGVLSELGITVLPA